MSSAVQISDELLQKLQRAADERRVGVSEYAESLLRQHVGDTPSKRPVTELPVAQQLEFKVPDIGRLSFGKILDILEDGYPISKMR